MQIIFYNHAAAGAKKTSKVGRTLRKEFHQELQSLSHNTRFGALLLLSPEKVLVTKRYEVLSGVTIRTSQVQALPRLPIRSPYCQGLAI